MNIVLQPEVAYFRLNDNIRLWDSDPPDGMFFRPVSFQVHDMITQETFFEFLQGRIVEFEDLTTTYE